MNNNIKNIHSYIAVQSYSIFTHHGSFSGGLHTLFQHQPQRSNKQWRLSHYNRGDELGTYSYTIILDF
jgi:hypothetical protein